MSYYQNGERIFEEGEEIIEPVLSTTQSQATEVDPPDTRRFKKFAEGLLRSAPVEISHYIRRLHHR